MKAISLWQPWATLIAVGAKRIETRHWPAPARVAIHAAKRKTELWICEEPPFDRHVGITTDAGAALPLGAIVATAVIDRCSEMTERSIRELAHRLPDEHAFGLYEPGRFAWILRDVAALPAPITVDGAQGFWTVPEDVVDQIPR